RHRYSYAEELLEHSQRIGKTYGLYEKALFQTFITGAAWQEDESRWLVTTDHGDRLTADFLVLACGRQSLPKLPRIPGIETYQGHTFHTSRWDYAYTGGDNSGNLTGLKDKRVGIIGTGATALQAVPHLAEGAQELLVFQRTPSTVGVRGQCETGPDWVDTSEPGWQRR
ncbi:monooxygenase, partial [Actinomycetospora atypica]